MIPHSNTVIPAKKNPYSGSDNCRSTRVQTRCCAKQFVGKDPFSEVQVISFLPPTHSYSHSVCQWLSPGLPLTLHYPPTLTSGHVVSSRCTTVDRLRQICGREKATAWP